MFTNEGSALPGGGSETMGLTGWLQVVCMVFLLAFGAWVIWYGPSCSVPLPMTVVQSESGADFCVVASMPKGGYSKPKACYRSQGEANDSAQRELEASLRALEQCSAATVDHLSLNGLRRQIKAALSL
ncbi:hypothetical protein [Ottowia sp.]|uniref:hypothetical protein n=1 Tax=Ottowia sp. TaxID=1898956 RepID=UPI0025E51C4F|nr:hypothetical protein [Ottowia sp.]MBK6616263.1 hypothetical protein [Ottowia sp.]